MGSISTIYNGVRTWLAGRALMDVAFSNRSTNGLQNKVIKAKFDEIESDLEWKSAEATVNATNVSDIWACNVLYNKYYTQVHFSARLGVAIPHNTLIELLSDLPYKPKFGTDTALEYNALVNGSTLSTPDVEYLVNLVVTAEKKIIINNITYGTISTGKTIWFTIMFANDTE